MEQQNPHGLPEHPSHIAVTLRVHRYQPSENATPAKKWTQDYTLNVGPHASVLDCLLQIKSNLDPSLAFRYSCGHGMCGSDAVAINGIPRLLCLTKVSDALADDSAPGHSTIDLAACPAFHPIRDLIANMEPMFTQIRKLKPYLQAAGALRTTGSGAVNVLEYLQHPDELEAFEQLTNCIDCGVCEGACPIYVQGSPFVGPAAAVAAGRFIFDSRDGHTQERLDALDSKGGIWACKGIRACTQRCPRGIDVSGAIWKIMNAIKENRGKENNAFRHTQKVPTD